MVHIEKTKTIFLSETTRSRALIYIMQHHQVDLYKVYSNNVPEEKNGPAPGATRFM